MVTVTSLVCTLFSVMAILSSPSNSLAAASVYDLRPSIARYSWSSVSSELICDSTVLTTGSTHGAPSSVLYAINDCPRSFIYSVVSVEYNLSVCTINNHYYTTSLVWLYIQSRVFDKNFRSVPNWFKSYIPTAPQSTMMDQSYSILIEGLNHVAPKWSNRVSKVGHLMFSLGQWYAILAYQIPWCNHWTTGLPLQGWWQYFNIAPLFTSMR